jgi:hypothetical protein
MGFELRRGMISETGPGWAVTDVYGNPRPGRWATRDEAHEQGYLGVYLVSGYSVVYVEPEGMTEAEAVQALGGLPDHDFEAAHARADDILLEFVPAAVADAYRAARERIGFHFA